MCSANHEESSDKMDVDEVIEMFKRFEDLHGVKYLSVTVIVKHIKAFVELHRWITTIEGKHNNN